MTVEPVVAPEMTKELSAEPFLHSHSFDIVLKEFEVRDEVELPLPVEQVDATDVLLVGYVQGKRALPLSS